MAVCNTIGIENFQTWRIFHHGYAPKMIAAYNIDRNHGAFANHFSDDKLPFLTKGKTRNPEPEDPPVEDGRLLLKSSKFYQVSPIDIERGKETKTYSFVLSLRIKKLPKYGDFETIMSFIMDFQIHLQIDWKGRLRAYGDEDNWVSLKGGLALNQTHNQVFLKVHFGRPRVATNAYWCWVMAQLSGGEEVGGTLNCMRIEFRFQYLIEDYR